MRMPQPLVASLVALAVATPAFAADEWTGAHIGIDLGYAQHTASITDGDYYYYGSTMNLQDEGTVLGVRVGYDKQIGSLVIGADFTWQLIDTESKERYSSDVDLNSSLEQLMALRVRAGLAVENSMIYVLAGVAQGDFSHQWIDDGDPNNSIPTFENDELGTQVGFGIETLVGSKLSVRGEVTRTDIPESAQETPSGGTYKFSDEVVSFTLGASYRF